MIKTALSNMVDTSHITTEHLKNRTTEGNKFKLWYSFQLPGKKKYKEQLWYGNLSPRIYFMKFKFRWSTSNDNSWVEMYTKCT